MEYNGYLIGPVIRQLRIDRKFTLDQMSEKTGLSISSIKQVEQGGRNLSMRSLYLFMEALNCDANTILKIQKAETDIALSIDGQLEALPEEQKEFLLKSFLFMLKQAKMPVS